MWQRIQTVFLIVGVVALLVSLIQPIWLVDVGGQKNVLTPFYLLSGDPTQKGESAVYQYLPYSVTAMLTIAAITLFIIEIPKYKRRVTQMKLGALNSFFLVGILLSSFFLSNQVAKTFVGNAGQYGLGFWLPGVAVLCNLLANRFIRRDEKMVRDSNRLR